MPQIIADLLSHDCQPKETAGDCTEDMEILAIILMSPSVLQELKMSLQPDVWLWDMLQANKDDGPNHGKMAESMKLFSPICDKLIVIVFSVA